MVRTNPDVDVESFTTDRLCDFINDAGPVAANLPDDAPAADQITANVEAAIDELRSRRVATDGGVPEPTVDDVIDDRKGDGVDHYLRHVTDEEYDVKIRHDGSIRTTVEDGVVVHKVVEAVDDDAHGDSVSWSQGRYTCPRHGTESTESERKHNEDDDTQRVVYTCDEDGCPFEVHAVMVRAEYGTPDYKRPKFFRATLPHVFDDDTFDAERFDSLVEAADHDDQDDRAGVANMIRKLAVDYTNVVRDSAYVKAEWEHDDDGTPTEKTADAYLDTVECERCGDEVDAGVERSHPHFGTVCPACEDATVWSVDDADLPDDVEGRMAEHKTFGVGNIVALLRDVRAYPNFVAKCANDSDDGMFGVDTDDVDPEDVGPIHTGKQGKRSMGRGDWERGTGLRRSTDGVFNGMSNWRTLLADAVDTGLIERADDADDVADEDTNAKWSTTDKGDRVFDELARCETCGGDRKPFARVSHYQAGRRSESDTSLTLRCPSCDTLRSGSKGDSSTSACLELPGVDY